MNSVYVSEVVDCSGVTGLKPTNTYTPQTTAVNCFLISALFLSHFFIRQKLLENYREWLRVALWLMSPGLRK